MLVDQNDRVEPGDLLVKLDREPFEVAVAQAEASLEEARANVVQSRAQVASQIARARASYYQRKNAQEALRRQVAILEPSSPPSRAGRQVWSWRGTISAGARSSCRMEASARKMSTRGTTP